jgi:hypothetical protein
MGTSKNGVLGSARGKIANVVYYQLNGQDVIRGIGGKNKVKSGALKAQHNSMTILMALFAKVKPYLKAGFKNEAAGTIYNYHNIATAYNRVHAIKITDNIPHLTFENILLSRGTAILPQNAACNLDNSQLHFSWDADLMLPWITNQDQAMMLAYYPEINEAIFNIAGAVRSRGFDHLTLPQSYINLSMHIYLSFVAEDRESVSNSLYLGKIH